MYAVHNQYDFFVTELHADAKLREKFLRMMLKWYQGSSIITQFNQKYNYIILDISFHTHYSYINMAIINVENHRLL